MQRVMYMTKLPIKNLLKRVYRNVGDGEGMGKGWGRLHVSL